MTDHTPEPWLPAPQRNDGIDIHVVYLARADYERARACVNACAGIPTKQLTKTHQPVALLIAAAKAVWEDLEITADTSGIVTEVSPEALDGLDLALAPFRKD